MKVDEHIGKIEAQVEAAVIKTTISMRIWAYMGKPFQVARLLELLYMFDWLWYAILSFIPDKYINDVTFTYTQTILSNFQISSIAVGITILHMIALYRNIIWLRKLNLLINSSLLLYLVAYSLQTQPISASIGYYIVLIGVSTLAFWRIGEAYEQPKHGYIIHE